MIKALIIDDEEHCSKVLKEIIKANFPNVNIVACGASALEAEILIAKLQPDLVFLDVEMPEKTGFELLSGLSDINFEIIFTTAYEKYALHAIKASALDYLLKPVDVDELKEAITRFELKKSHLKVNEQVKVMLQHYHNKSDKMLALSGTGSIEFLKIEEIIRLKAEINYTVFYLIDKTTFVVAKSLKEYEGILEPYGFFRVHNSHIVNLKYIKRFQRAGGGSLILMDNTEIFVSKYRKDELFKVLNEFLTLSNK